jgi:hypothetical protein
MEHDQRRLRRILHASHRHWQANRAPTGTIAQFRHDEPGALDTDGIGPSSNDLKAFCPFQARNGSLRLRETQRKEE